MSMLRGVCEGQLDIHVQQGKAPLSCEGHTYAVIVSIDYALCCATSAAMGNMLHRSQA